MNTYQKVIASLSLAIMLLLVGCTKDEQFIQTPQDETEQTMEQLVQNVDDHLPPGYDKEAWKAEVFRPDIAPSGTMRVKIPNLISGEMETKLANIIDDYVVIEGDMVLGTVAEVTANNNKATSRGVVKDGFSRRWKYGIIPYLDFSSHPRKDKIKAAMDEVAENTNLSFVLRTNESKYLTVHESDADDGNYVIGLGAPYSGYPDYNTRGMYITDNASQGTIMHELLHVAGMAHEQSRCDRDDHVLIYEGNIISGREAQFKKRCNGYSDVYNYDYGSIMHYSPFAFSYSGLATILPSTSWPHLFISRLAQMGQRSGLSDQDISTVNHMYPIDENHDYALLTHYSVPNTDQRLNVVSIGNQLMLSYWNGWGAQRFQFTKAGDGYYFIRDVGANKYLTIPNSSTSSNVGVKLQSLTRGNNQKFRLDPVSWGTYKIIAKHSGKEINTPMIFPGQIIVQGDKKYTGGFTTIKL